MSNTAVAQRIPFSVMINKPNYQAMINRTIQDPARARRFVSAIVSAVSVNPALQECTPQTILSGALLGESLNLSPSPQLGQYYLVPFKQKERRDRDGNIISQECTNAQFVLGYKGLIQLALRSGQYKRLNVISVKEGELCGWNPITEEFSIIPIEDENEREQARTVGYLASFEYLNGFTKTIYWSKEKMIAHADRFSAAFSKEATKGRYPKVSFADYEANNYPAKEEWLYSSFWYKDFDGMAHKTMLRQLISKWGVMSIDLQTAFEADAAAENENYFEDPEAQLPAASPIHELPPETLVEAPESAQQEEQVSLNDV
ncbi:MAG: recombinase [Oscillospiraceae bacterium]|jgi:recombination protein RecT|nr:recombinase [Oscillospiraceae bacterium]